MRYTLRQLQVFLATAHHENISLAAAELNMSQSAASSALKELESQFDIQLFDRVGKRLQINELGHSLRPQAQALLDQASDLQSAFSQHQTPGDLKVGATLTIGNYLAVPIMSAYKKQHPGAQVALEVSNTETIAKRVANFELDIGLIEGELQSPSLELIEWCEDELCVFAAPNDPLTKRRKITDQHLLAAKWIVRESGSGTRQTFDRAMSGILPDLNIELELQHTEAIKRAVEAQLGIGCLSKVTLKEAFKRGSLKEIKIPQRNFKRRFYFVLHQQKYISAGIEKWISLCKKQR
ncbi:MAG: LysR family transcriptional regulator [Pseudomonadales bacterium]|nr:LysR family transcriptional regulator [Pseudomonadales bacterium]